MKLLIDASAHITPAEGSVFADLDFEPHEAGQLMSALVQWSTASELSQADAARLLGVSGPQLSDIFSNGNLHLTVDMLIDMLLRVGKRVELTVA